MDELRDVAAEARDFTNETRAEIREIKRGHEKDSLDLGREIAIHQRHLEFVLEIRYRPQAAHDHRRADVLRELREQSFERLHVHTLVGNGGANQRNPLFERKQRLLRDIDCDGHDELIHELERAMDQVFVTLRDRVETPGIDGDALHRKNVTAVSPYRRVSSPPISRFASCSIANTVANGIARNTAARRSAPSVAYGGSANATSYCPGWSRSAKRTASTR